MTETRRQLIRSVDPVLICLVIAETAIVWLMASLLLTAEPGEGQALLPLAVFAVMIVAASLPRALDAFDLWDPGFTVVMAAGMVVTTLMLIKTSSFPDASWLEFDWLRRPRRALTLRSSTAEYRFGA